MSAGAILSVGLPLIVSLFALAVYSVGLQRKATNRIIPQSMERQARASERAEESVALQRESAARYEQSLAQIEESLKLQREANDLLREIIRQMNRVRPS